MRFIHLNKVLYIFTIISFLCIILCSCDKLTSQEKEIIGNYKVSELHSIEASNGNPELGVSIDGKSSFTSDRKLKTKGLLKINFDINLPQNNYYNSFTLEYAFSIEGRWEVKDGIMTEELDYYNLTFHSGYPAREDANTPGAIETFKKSFGTLADSFLKTYIAKSGIYKIQELTSKRMMLENNGQRITYFRLSNEDPF